MMTKRIKLIYALLLAIALPMLTACSSEDTLGNSDPTQSEQGEKITVRFRVSQAGTNTMRAWQDKVAEDKEMMNVWTVVGVKATDAGADEDVVGIWACKPSGEPDREIDDTEEIVNAELNKESKYRFYSFANMSPAKVVELLGITTTISGINDYMTTGSTSVTSFDIPEDTKVNYTTAKGKTVAMSGNGFDPTATNAFDAIGIPMSNVQEFNSLEDNDLKDLIVVRMLAKVELWLYNGKGESADGKNDIEINSITLTSVTKNGQNINLFPHYTKGGENEMESAGVYHGSIQPAPNWKPTIVDIMVKQGTDNSVLLEETPSTSSTTPWTIGAIANKYVNGTGKNGDEPVKITFYVNESATPTTPHANSTTEQDFGHFYLELDVVGDMQETGKPKKLRYTMIDDKRDATTGEITESWNYIARNDYRIIPIVLDDYRLDMIPYDFPAIGVLPASVKEEDGIYTINFHDYGHFHLQPKVTRYSDGSLVPYGVSGTGDDKTYWVLAGTNVDTDSQKLSALTSAWGSWKDATKAVLYTNTGADAFYRPEDSSNSFTTTTTDGDEVGGEPVWYRNNASPQWASDWATSAGGSGGSTVLGFQPFIFGYIADPFPSGTQTDKLTSDRKVYHEFTINLYKDGNTSYPRTMIYRLYMILDTDQMLYRGDGNTNGAPRVRQPHCTH